MKPYGVRKKDANCCPGHDKYTGRKSRVNNNSRNEGQDRPRKAKERQNFKQNWRNLL